MKAKNPLKKLTLIKTTVAHLEVEQMIAARGGSCGDTWKTNGCPHSNSVYPPTQISCE
jgi:natural product precursor